MNRLILTVLICAFSWSGLHSVDVRGQPASPHQHNGTVPPACNGIDIACATSVNVVFDNTGTLHLVWVANGHVVYGQSSDYGKTIVHIQDVADHGKSLDAGTDARPQIVINDQGHILIAYAFFKDSNWNAQINLVKSNNGGIAFTQPKSILPSRVSERFPAMFLDGHGRLHLVWIDKYLVHQKRQAGDKALGGSVAYSYSDDLGDSFATPQIINDSSCECCHIAMTRDGHDGIELTYRTIFDNGIRDHVVQVIDKSGQFPIRRVSDDHWKTDVCPHQGPTISLDQLGRTHVAWFTMGDNRQGVYIAHAAVKDGRFSDPVKVGMDGMQVSRPYLLSVDNKLWLATKQFDGRKTNIVIQTSNDNGDHWEIGKIIEATEDYSDHPILVAKEKMVFLSWFSRQFGYKLVKLN